jgi:SAM-dependent MidA family methyltransferase
MTPVSRQLREEIKSEGPISFAAFMRRALYDSECGYYSKPRPIGKAGDFFTSVSVGALFGELLAFQFARWIEELPSHGPIFHCVEAGAHDGRLACDILHALQTSEPGLFASLLYWIVEPSSIRRKLQQRTLAEFSNVQWFGSSEEIRGRINGVFFSNELLDAMPVHVFRWNKAARDWHEMGVDLCGNDFIWVELPGLTICTPDLPRELLDVLPDGYTLEHSPAAMEWWAEAAKAVSAGRLIAIDYGGPIEELLTPCRNHGTLRAYSRHRGNLAVLENPGEQDITAHVNFTALQRIGAASGLKTEIFTTQSQFLTNIASQLWTRSGSWPREKVRQFQTLTHPEHLGHPFRVLVQAR